MKFTSIAASAIALCSIAIFSQPGFAQNGKVVYFCGKSSRGIPTTYARIPEGKRIPVISWEKVWSQYTPEKCCHTATNSVATFRNENFSRSDKVVYFCGKSTIGVLTTYTRTPKGKRISVIGWEKAWSNEHTLEKRCEIVSQKFQEAEEKGRFEIDRN